MGLKLILGRAGSGKTRCCLEDIRKRLRQSPAGRPLILLLPEHATFQVERELAATPGLGGFARAYVFGFRRLAHRVLLEAGGAVRPHITELGKKLVLSRLLMKEQKKLKVFQRAANQRTFAETLAGMIQEFKTYAVSPQQLEQFREQAGESPLADKLQDLSLLYQDFAEFLQDRYTDPEDYLSLLADKVARSALIPGAEVWVDGFTWFNPQETAVLAQILGCAAGVTVTLCLADAQSPEHSSETALLHRQWETRRKLLDLARSLNISVEEQQLTGCGRFVLRPLLAHLEQRFFTYPTLLFSGESRGLVLVEAANRRVEVEGIARDIIRLCREEGYRWRDIAILLRDGESYADIVETVLTDYEIPFFNDRQRQPVHHPLAELLRSSLEVLTGRWRYDAVFRCLKTDLFPLCRDEIDELENYVLEFGIRGSRWTSEEPWNFVRRLSLDEDAEINDDRQEQLDRINGIRRKAVRPLADFAAQVKQAADVRAVTTALYQLLLELEVPEKLAQWADKAEAAGDLEQAGEHRQMWDSVIQLLEQLVETCGDEQMDLAAYADLVNDGLEGLKLSLIPPGLDYVTVSPLAQTSVANLRAVYVPGVNDGVLPMRGRGEGILTDAERTRLAQAGLELAPGATADTFAERFLVYTALTRAGEYLWVSYPLADEEGKGLSPSLVIKRLKELAGVNVKSLPLEPRPGREKEYLARTRPGLSALAVSLRQYKNHEKISPLWRDVYNWTRQRPALTATLRRSLAGLFHSNQEKNLPGELSACLYPRYGRLRGSVTRFESFRACPFKHFAQYGLSLKERAVFRLQAPELGRFFHAALKSFGDKMQAAGRSWGSVGDTEYQAICREIVNELAPKLQNEILLSSEQHKHLLGRLERTVERSVHRLVEFDRVSRFKPVALERVFGRGKDSLPPLVYRLKNGTTLEISGQIDRLDEAEKDGRKYILVIDYKSGGAWLKLTEVFYGLRLQLLTYLLVAKNAEELFGGEKCLPGGVLYYFLKNPNLSGSVRLSPEQITKKINGMLKMPGWLLADPEVVRLLDSTMEKWSDFLKVALTKDNTFYSNCLSYLKTPAEFRLLLAHVEDMLVETAEKILSGDIAISPYLLTGKNACSYCRYSPVCQFDRQLPENDYRKLEQPADEDIMQQLAAKGGKKDELV